MQTITIKTDQKISRILIGENFENYRKYLPSGKTILITDDNLLKHYGNQLRDFPVISIGLGEKNKTLESISGIFNELIALEADRSTYIVAVGGGIVCDVAGFAASIFMRGLSYGFISTTLLSQVDASVGGKNGVNFNGYKNMVGTFNQPDFVIADIKMLRTLNEKEYRSGLAEIIKAAVIKDESLFNYIDQHVREILERDPDTLEKLICDSVQIKAKVVEADENEKGERKKLNFGHTFGHAIEHLTGMLHGEAISIGMEMAANLSVKTGLLKKADHDRITDLLQKFELPVQISLKPEELIAAMKKDKKKQNDVLHFILVNKIGNAVIQPMNIHQIESLI